MFKFLYANRLLIGVLAGVILIVIGGTYYLKHLDNERMLEKERNLRLDYKQWHLPEGAKARIGSGTVRTMQYSPDGNLLAVVSSIGVWILDAQTAAPLHLLAAHTGVINSISFSADSRTLAVGTENGEAQLWDTATGEHQKTFTRHDYFFSVNNVFLMPDSRTLAVIHNYSIVDLWDIATGKRKDTLSAVENDATDDNVKDIPNFYMSLGGHRNSFSSDGKTIASDSSDDAFHFWDIATRKEVQTLKAKPSNRYGELASFSSDLQTLAIASYSDEGHKQIWKINLWDVNTQTQRTVMEKQSYGLPFLVFSPDGNFIASPVNSAIHIWDVNTGKEKRRFKGYRSAITTVTFSPDSRTLVSASYDNTLRFWDVDTGKEKKTVAGYGGFFPKVSVSADAQKLIGSTLGSSTIRLWNTNTGQHEKNFVGHEISVWNTVYSPDGSKLASRSIFKNTIPLWDVNTGKISKLKGPRKHLSGVAFSRDGEVLASWGSSGRNKYIIQHWDVETEQIQRTLQLTFQERFSVPADLYFDKKMFASIGRFVYLKLFVWNLTTNDYNITDLEDTEIGGGTEIGVGRFSPDGRVLAIVYGGLTKMERNIVLRDVATGEHIRTLTGHINEVKCLAFSPDSRTLASGSKGIMREKTIRLWDIETGGSRAFTDPNWAESQQKYNAITAASLAFSPDGQTLASGMGLGDIYLWETATGTKKKMLRGHSERVSNIFFSADGQTLISVSDDGTVLIWDLTHR
jgi:WD40 repeat protein